MTSRIHQQQKFATFELIDEFYGLDNLFELCTEPESAIPLRHDEKHQTDSKAMSGPVVSSCSLPKEESKSAPMEKPILTCAACGSAYISGDAQLTAAPDVAWDLQLAPMNTAPRKYSILRGKMKKMMQRIWAGTKTGRKATRTAQMIEFDVRPPRYTRFPAEAVEVACIQISDMSTGSKTNGSAVSNPTRDANSKPTGSNDQKPIESNSWEPKNAVVESTSGSQSESNSSIDSYPRLTQLVRNNVDTVKLLRSVLVFIMFITFYAELDIIKTDTGSLFPWSTTIFTRAEADPTKFFAWDVFEITRDVCTLVRDLEEKLRRNRWFSASRQDKDLLIKLVLKPAEALEIQADYALEIAGTFRQDRHVGKGINYYTLVDLWKPRYRKNLPARSYRMLDLGDTLASHASFIASLNLQEEQQSELADAMAKYCKERKLNELHMSETLKQKVMEELKYHPHRTCCWPMRDGYMDLFRMLGKTDGSSWRDVLRKDREMR